MKIVNSSSERFPVTLGETDPGDCVQFDHVFHQKHKWDAKFLVLRVPGEYVNKEKRFKGGSSRIMVANLETGSASLVDRERTVHLIDAEVVCDD